jgi:alanine racemase
VTIDERLAAAGLPPLPRRAWLEIDVEALENNVAVIRELIGPNVNLSAVVKADAYGHGMVPVARVFEHARVDRLCVASLDEAIALRDGGIRAPILLLYPVSEAGAHEARRLGVAVTADQRSASQIDEVAAEIEVDTGLTRGGVKPEDIARVAAQLANTGASGGVWTHIASPEDAAATAAQVTKFEHAVASLDAGDSPPRRHVAATGALFTARAPLYEGVRIGLGLYGLVPEDLPIAAERREFAQRLRPAMSLKCQPLRVAEFPAGTPVSYGGRWVTSRESVIATLPIGYGDGWSRAYSQGAEALVRGRRVPLVGSVAMDAVMADVTEIPGVGVDDEFVLLGRQEAQEVTANDLARLRNTIPWEVVTSMSLRVPRVYHRASVLMGLRTLNGEFRAGVEAAT